jgi:hypothetical protein
LGRSGFDATRLVQKDGPGLEALKLGRASSRRSGRSSAPVLFVDPLQRDAFTALVEHDDLHDAIASASPEVAGLLAPDHRGGTARRGSRLR